MEPITFIVTALTLGIAAGLKPTAEQAIKDAYIGLKILIESRYKVNLNNLENKPNSKAQIAAVEENLIDAGAEKDKELLDKAKELFDFAKQYVPDMARARGIDLDNIEAEYVKARRIIARGSAQAIKMKDVKVKGGIEIEDITADSGTLDPKA